MVFEHWMGANYNLPEATDSHYNLMKPWDIINDRENNVMLEKRRKWEKLVYTQA